MTCSFLHAIGAMAKGQRRKQQRTDIALVSDKEFQALVDRFNNTPRKCLDYRTPQEVLGEQIAILQAG